MHLPNGVLCGLHAAAPFEQPQVAGAQIVLLIHRETFGLAQAWHSVHQYMHSDMPGDKQKPNSKQQTSLGECI